jgi:hypothetical protein
MPREDPHDLMSCDRSSEGEIYHLLLRTLILLRTINQSLSYYLQSKVAT